VSDVDKPEGKEAQAERDSSEIAPEGNGLLADLGARGLGAALRPLAGLAGVADDIKEMTGLVRRMAANTDALPDVTETLHAIRERTERMDREVTEMHAAVEELREMLAPVATQLEGVTRLTNRLPGGRKYRRAQAEADAAAAAEAQALDEEVARARDAE